MSMGISVCIFSPYHHSLPYTKVLQNLAYFSFLKSHVASSSPLLLINLNLNFVKKILSQSNLPKFLTQFHFWSQYAWHRASLEIFF